MDSHQDIPVIINALSQSPGLLRGLLAQVPNTVIKTCRRSGKWSVHENACHLGQTEKMIYERFKAFRDQSHPSFSPYLPGKTIVAKNLLQLDLDKSLDQFAEDRKQLVRLVSAFSANIWQKEAQHPEYHHYNAQILLRHTLMHDHFHMYRIEELWLTKDEYL